MKMSNKELKFSVIKYDIEIAASCVFAGNDLIVALYGGDSPHIGSVSTGVPVLINNQEPKISATVSTYNLLGHKDNFIGDFFAKQLAILTNRVCVVTCGIHFDDFDNDKLNKLNYLSKILLQKLVKYFSDNLAQQ